VVLGTGGHAKAKAAAPLFARDNTLSRIDPATNKVSAVVDVGASPSVAAAGGHSVWVYNQGDSTISEIDAATNRIRKTTAVPVGVDDVSRFAGPVLAADASGAWFVSGGHGGGQPLLTRIPVHGRKREYRLDVRPTGVAVGDRAVWVVGRAKHDYQVLRIDPANGRVDARTRFRTSTPVDSIAFGYGAVWVVGSANATLYRIDARTARRDGRLVVGTSRAGRPEIMRRGADIWVREIGRPGSNGTTIRVDPSALSIYTPGVRKRAHPHDPRHEDSTGRQRAVHHLDCDRLGKPLADGCSVAGRRVHLPRVAQLGPQRHLRLPSAARITLSRSSTEGS
jgi:YVTN family beta-propeller protein